MNTTVCCPICNKNISLTEKEANLACRISGVKKENLVLYHDNCASYLFEEKNYGKNTQKD